ncbi:hypothetical protein AAZX31_14G140800 [Glycine max]
MSLFGSMLASCNDCYALARLAFSCTIALSAPPPPSLIRSFSRCLSPLHDRFSLSNSELSLSQWFVQICSFTLSSRMKTIQYNLKLLGQRLFRPTLHKSLSQLE